LYKPTQQGHPNSTCVSHPHHDALFSQALWRTCLTTTTTRSSRRTTRPEAAVGAVVRREHRPVAARPPDLLPRCCSSWATAPTPLLRTPAAQTSRRARHSRLRDVERSQRRRRKRQAHPETRVPPVTGDGACRNCCQRLLLVVLLLLLHPRLCCLCLLFARFLCVLICCCAVLYLWLCPDL
jgi:hypothetical protein